MRDAHTEQLSLPAHRSVCWVINGQYAMWPVSDSAQNTNIEGYTALVGGLLFWIGAYLAILEGVCGLVSRASSILAVLCAGLCSL